MRTAVALCALLFVVVVAAEWQADIMWHMPKAFTPTSASSGTGVGVNNYLQNFFYVQSETNISFYTINDHGDEPALWKTVASPECPDYNTFSGPDARTIYSTMGINARCSCQWSETNRYNFYLSNMFVSYFFVIFLFFFLMLFKYQDK